MMLVLGFSLVVLGLLGTCWGIGDVHFTYTTLGKIVFSAVLFILGICICVDAVRYKNDTTYNYIEAEPVSYSNTQTFFEDSEGNILRVDGNFPGGEYLLIVTDDEVLAVWQNIMIGDVG